MPVNNVTANWNDPIIVKGKGAPLNTNVGLDGIQPEHSYERLGMCEAYAAPRWTYGSAFAGVRAGLVKRGELIGTSIADPRAISDPLRNGIAREHLNPEVHGIKPLGPDQFIAVKQKHSLSVEGANTIYALYLDRDRNGEVDTTKDGQIAGIGFYDPENRKFLPLYSPAGRRNYRGGQ
ncbi:MAG: hypothetical protein VKK32_01045 [Candidatus Melainabacteria bacterium]|nr:hypothetical protein [Candidatus Melainabacteria bacterium]